MKKLKLVIIVMMLFLLTGCSKSVLETDEQTDQAAEYLGGLLLKHTISYKESLIYEETPEPVESKNQDTKKDKKENENKAENLDEKKTSKGDSDSDLAKDWSEVFQANHINVSYQLHKFYNSYPDSADSSLLPIEAGAGKKLLVVSFAVKNQSNKKITINMIKNIKKYQLEIDGSKSYEPLQTVLLNDLQFLETNLKSGSKTTAVLVFEVDKKVEKEKSTMYLTASDKNVSAKIQLN